MHNQVADNDILCTRGAAEDRKLHVVRKYVRSALSPKMPSPTRFFELRKAYDRERILLGILDAHTADIPSVSDVGHGKSQTVDRQPAAKVMPLGMHACWEPHQAQPAGDETHEVQFISAAQMSAT